MKRNHWIILGGLGTAVICMACVLCLGIWVLLQARTSSPTATLQDDSSIAESDPSSSAASPFVLNGPKSYQEVVDTAKSMTEIKRNDYYKSLKGKNVRWTGTVADVSSNGNINVRFITKIAYEAHLTNVPVATASNFNLNDPIQFDGTITDVSDMFGTGSPIITLKTVSLKKP